MKKSVIFILLLILCISVSAQKLRNVSSTYHPYTAVSGGGEILSNGGFDNSDDWTLGTYWAIAGGQCSYTNTAGSNMSQSAANMAGEVQPSTTYILEFDIISTDYKTDMYVFDAAAIEYYNLHISYEGTGTDLQFEFTTPANIGVGGIAFAASNWSFVIDNISLTVKP